MSRRAGFTLVELIMGTVVLAIIGTILTRMLLQDSRFVSKVEAMMDARQSARAAMNTMAVELRMISNGGLLAATPTTLSVRAPYAWGLFCEPVASEWVASLVPTDPQWYSSAIPDGVAWRSGVGTYYFDDYAIVSPSTQNSACSGTDWSVEADGDFELIEITMSGATPEMYTGTVMYVYQTITYEFRASNDLPGRIGLFRDVNGSESEILAPFDTTAGFSYFTNPNAPPESNPFPLSEVTGVELRLYSESEIIPQGTSDPQSFYLQTRVTFLNVDQDL